MEIVAILWNIFLIGVLLTVLAVVGLFAAIGTERRRENPLKEAQRRAELDRARERAAARQAEQRIRLLGQWADERASDHVRSWDRRKFDA